MLLDVVMLTSVECVGWYGKYPFNGDGANYSIAVNILQISLFKYKLLSRKGGSDEISLRKHPGQNVVITTSLHPLL